MAYCEICEIGGRSMLRRLEILCRAKRPLRQSAPERLGLGEGPGRAARVCARSAGCARVAPPATLRSRHPRLLQHRQMRLGPIGYYAEDSSGGSRSLQGAAPGGGESGGEPGLAYAQIRAERSAQANRAGEGRGPTDSQLSQ